MCYTFKGSNPGLLNIQHHRLACLGCFCNCRLPCSPRHPNWAQQASNLRYAHLRKPKTFTKHCTHPQNSPWFRATGDPLLRLKYLHIFRKAFSSSYILPPERKPPSVQWTEIFHINHTRGLLVTPNDSKQTQPMPLPIFLLPWPTCTLSQQNPDGKNLSSFHPTLDCHVGEEQG